MHILLFCLVAIGETRKKACIVEDSEIKDIIVRILHYVHLLAIAAHSNYRRSFIHKLTEHNKG